MRWSWLSFSCEDVEGRTGKRSASRNQDIRGRTGGEKETNEEGLASVRVDDDRGSRVDLGTVDDGAGELFQVVRGDGLGERQLAGEDGRHTDLVRLEIDVGRDDRSSGVVDSLALRDQSQSHETAKTSEGKGDGPSCAFGRVHPSSRGPA